ncbi:MAG: NADH-quinone oxidoreductase subunit J [Acidobacteriota bacterium]
MEAILFYLLAAVLVTFSILTVTARNPVRSAVFLISALLAIAGLFFLLKAEFVGAVQILVYVGGIMVLFLFVIMLVSLRDLGRRRKASRQWKTGVALAVVLSLQVGWLLIRGNELFQTPAARGMVENRTLNTEQLGRLLYTTYLLPFEIASILLLVAIVGAVVMAKKQG